MKSLLAALSLALVASAGDRLSVVATIPDLADIAREIGGDRVDVKCVTKGRENIHAVQIRPSDLVAFNKADVLIEVGLSLEHAFVPGLMMAARNPKIEPGQPGFIAVSEGWEAIQRPESLSRQQGTDLHPQGNPHMNLDPRSGRHMAERILAGLSAVDPGSRAAYEARAADYLRRLDAAAERWKEIEKGLAGRKVITYHRDFDYFANATGIEIAATIEPKPGIPPTPDHVAEVVQVMRDGAVTVIVTAAWSNNKHVDELARRTGAKVVEIPVLVGGVAGADTWIGLMDELHRRLAEGFGLAARSE